MTAAKNATESAMRRAANTPIDYGPAARINALAAIVDASPRLRDAIVDRVCVDAARYRQISETVEGRRNGFLPAIADDLDVVATRIAALGGSS